MSVLTRDAAHAVLTLENDTDVARAAHLVLEKVSRPHQILRDLIDIGEVPESAGRCAAEGPRQLARMKGAWQAAIAEAGPRDPHCSYYEVTAESEP